MTKKLSRPVVIRVGDAWYKRIEGDRVVCAESVLGAYHFLSKGSLVHRLQDLRLRGHSNLETEEIGDTL